MKTGNRTSRASSMIEMLGVMVVILVFVGMAAVSAVRTKSIEADAHARLYASLLQTYMSDYAKRQKDTSQWQALVNAYNAAPAATKDITPILSVLSASVGGDHLLTPTTGSGPMKRALDGYTLEFKSSPLAPLVVKRDGQTIFPIE